MTPFRILLLTLSSGCLASIVNLLVASAAIRVTQVPKDFPPFTFLPILAGSFGGAVLAALAFSVLGLVSRPPDRLFLFVAVVALALSFALPLRLSYTQSPRFAGVTPAAQMVLVLMHTVVATTTVATFLTASARFRVP